MRAVRIALTRTARMHMHVGNDAQATALADVPQLAEVAAVEPNDAGIQGMRVQIVIENEVDDPRPAICAVSAS